MMKREMFLALLVFLVFLFIAFSGCLQGQGQICIDNIDEVLNNHVEPHIKSSIYQAPSQACQQDKCDACSGNWYDCSGYLDSGFCKICKLEETSNGNAEVYFDPPLNVEACADTSLLGEKCEFGCNYFVCTPYKQDIKKKTIFSGADVAQSKRKYGDDTDNLVNLASFSSNNKPLNPFPIHFLHSQCSFKKLTKDEFKKLKKDKALFITYRLGAGRNFEDFELANMLIPLSSASTALNPNGGVDKYELYLTNDMIDNKDLCEKSGEFWKIKSYDPNGDKGERINKFTTFSECMLNAHDDYLGSTSSEERRPFVPMSFCYSEDYLDKHLPYLDSSNGLPFSKEQYILYLSPNYKDKDTLITLQPPHSDNIYSYDVSEINKWFSDTKNNPGSSNGFYIGYEYNTLKNKGFREMNDYYLNRFLDEYTDKIGNSLFHEKADPYYFASTYYYEGGDDSQYTPQEKIPGHDIYLFPEGYEYKQTYSNLLRKVPEYYTQFKEGSHDRQGRPKLGAEYECEDGSDCLSSFCSKRDYERTSCTGYDTSGNEIQVPCGCTLMDCNYFNPESYTLFDGTNVDVNEVNKPYLDKEAIENKHTKVYVMKQNNFGKGADRFLYWVNLGSEPYYYDEDSVSHSDLYSGVILKGDGKGNSFYFTSDWSSKKLSEVCDKTRASSGKNAITRYNVYSRVCPDSAVPPVVKKSLNLEPHPYLSGKTKLDLSYDPIVYSFTQPGGDNDIYCFYRRDNGANVWDYCEIKGTEDINYFFDDSSFEGDSSRKSTIIYPSKIGMTGDKKNINENCKEVSLSRTPIDHFVVNLHKSRYGREQQGTWESEYYCVYPIRGRPYYLMSVANSIQTCTQYNTGEESCKYGGSSENVFRCRGFGADSDIQSNSYSTYDPTWALFEGYVKNNDEIVGVRSLYDSNGNPTFNKDIFGAGPYIAATVVDSHKREVMSKTFVEKIKDADGNLIPVKMYLMDYVVSNPDSLDRVASSHSYKDWIFASFHGSPDEAVLSNNINAYLFDIVSNDVPPLTPLGYENDVSNEEHYGIQELKRCAATGSQALVIPMGGETSNSYKKLSDFLTLGPKAYPDVKTQDNGNGEAFIDFSILDRFVSTSLTKTDFPVYNACNDGSITAAFCFNPYFVKYDKHDGETGSYTGKSVYDVSTILKYYNTANGFDQNRVNKLRNALIDNFEACKDIPPKYYCLGSWAGDDYTGTCYGDMAISAYVFIGNIGNAGTNDNPIYKFGNCKFEDNGLTGLDVHEFGVCEANTPFNMAFDEIQSNVYNQDSFLKKEYGSPIFSLSNYFENEKPRSYSAIVTLLKGKSNNPLYWNFFKEVGKIVGASIAYEYDSNLMGENDYNEWNPHCIGSYLYNTNLWEYFEKNPLTNAFIYSYTLPIKGFLYFYNKYLSQEEDEPCYDYCEYEQFESHCYDSCFYAPTCNLDNLEDLPIFYGAFTKHSTKKEKNTPPEYSDLTDKNPEISFYSNDSFNPDNFYPSSYYIKNKLISYMSRGILPVMVVEDPDLYINKYTDFYEVKDNFIPEVDSHVPLFASKLFNDIQIANRDPKAKSGFSSYGSIPLGSVVVVPVKLKFDNSNPLSLTYISDGYTKYNTIGEIQSNLLARTEGITKGCPTCINSLMVDVGPKNVFSLYKNENDKDYSFTRGEIGDFINSLIALIFKESPTTYNGKPSVLYYCSSYVNSADLTQTKDYSSFQSNVCEEGLKGDLPIIIYKFSIDVRGIKEENAKFLLDNLIYLSNRTLISLNKSTIFYIKDLIYDNEDELNLFFSYLNYRKPDLISSGNMGIQFEDVVLRNNVVSSDSEKHLYMISSSDPGKVEPGLCQITKNLLPIGGLLTIRSTQPIDVKKDCDSTNCIDSDEQCLNDACSNDPSCSTLKVNAIYCKIRKGDGTTLEFYINSYNSNMADFLGLSLTQSGFTICDNPKEDSIAYKTVAAPAQYVVPITYSADSSLGACYPSTVTPQELQEIFTSGIKFATCYPVIVSKDLIYPPSGGLTN